MAKQDEKKAPAPDEQRGGGSTPPPHETPMPSEGDRKDALSAGGDKSALNQQAQVAGQSEGGDISTAPLSGKVVRRENQGPREVALPNLPDNALTIVDEDVYEEFFLEGSDRPLYRLRYARGQVVLQREYDAVTAGKSGGDAFSLSPAIDTAGDASQQVVGQEGRVGGTVERN